MHIFAYKSHIFFSLCAFVVSGYPMLQMWDDWSGQYTITRAL